MEWQVISHDLFRALVRYFSVSAGIYVFILLGLYLLIDWLQVDKIVSYILIYLSAYVTEYVVTLTLVFRKDHAWQKMAKFAVNTFSFLAIGTVLFKGLLSFQVNYLLATLGVAIILLPLRFLSNRYFVYK